MTSTNDKPKEVLARTRMQIDTWNSRTFMRVHDVIEVAIDNIAELIEDIRKDVEKGESPLDVSGLHRPLEWDSINLSMLQEEGCERAARLLDMIAKACGNYGLPPLDERPGEEKLNALMEFCETGETESAGNPESQLHSQIMGVAERDGHDLSELEEGISTIRNMGESMEPFLRMPDWASEALMQPVQRGLIDKTAAYGVQADLISLASSCLPVADRQSAIDKVCDLIEDGIGGDPGYAFKWIGIGLHGMPAYASMPCPLLKQDRLKSALARARAYLESISAERTGADISSENIRDRVESYVSTIDRHLDRLDPTAA